jgi:hypothetical protein
MRTRSLLICALIVSGLLLPMVQISRASGPPYSWSIGSTPIDSYSGNSGVGDVLPSAFQASNGTLWLAWQSDLHDINGGIFYKTMNTTGSWTNPVQFTIGTLPNISPFVTQLSNGTIVIFWAYKPGTNYDIYYKRYVPSTNTWSSSVQLTSSSLDDLDPTGAVGRDGTLWVFWQRTNKTGTEDQQIFYRTLSGNSWSSEKQLTSDPAGTWNWSPTAVAGKDGNIRIVYSRGQGTVYTFNLYTKIYNGSSWSSPVCISAASACASPVNDDERSSVMQDRNGTLWLFWGRQQSTSSAFWYVLYGKYSIDNGQTWSSETLMTSEPSGVTSQMPAAVQTSYASGKPIRVFYISNRQSSSFLNIWNLLSPSISPVHDVRVTSSTPFTTVQYPGTCCYNLNQAGITISVSLSNLGDSAETVPVTVTLTNRTVYTLPTQTISLSLGGTMTIYFTWNTTGVSPARYTLGVSAVPISGETVGNSYDSYYSQRYAIHLLPLGDIDQNGQVGVTDVGVCVYGFGASPGSAKWNPFCDINSNGYIDVIDVGIAVHNFGVIT